MIPRTHNHSSKDSVMPIPRVTTLQPLRSLVLKSALMAAMVPSLAPHAAAQTPATPTLQGVADQATIIDTINGVGIWADRKNFARLCPLFADTVAMDYTSLAGGTPVRVKADDLMKGWEEGLRPFRTQHMISNHQVTITGTAESVSHVHALHHVPNDLGISHWQIYGSHHHRLVRTPGGWKITAMTLTRLMPTATLRCRGWRRMPGSAGSQPRRRTIRP